MGKVLVFIFFFIWLRGSLPRLRYDQFMALGWKVLIPFSVVWILAVATVRVISLRGGLSTKPVYVVLGVIVVALLISFVLPERKKPEPEATDEPFDAFAGGFPVPPPGSDTPTPLRDAQLVPRGPPQGPGDDATTRGER